MRKLCVATSLLAALAIAVDAHAAGLTPTAPEIAPSSLFVIDQHRTTVVERIVNEWGDGLALSGAQVTREQLREMLFAVRADQLLAASLAGSITGLREVLATALIGSTAHEPRVLRTKALGDPADDVVYTPVTPCRLVETRPGTFAAVYQGGGAFAPNEIRNYAIQGGNGVCLTQLPSGLNPSAVQLQVFGIPINSGSSGDIEILPQGSSFGSTATEVYVGNVLINTVSTTANINLTNNQIGVQVRGGGANVAIDVVGYFKRALNSTTAAFEVAVNNNLALQIMPDAMSPLIVAGSNANGITTGASGATIAGGGAPGTQVTLGGVIYTCIGPCANRVTDAFGTVGGGAANLAGDAAGNATDRPFATVGGGVRNNATGIASSVGGGSINTASGDSSTVGGGLSNTASGFRSAVGGGQSNLASNDYDTVAGGYTNKAQGGSSTIGGGSTNTATGAASAISGGYLNTATGVESTVAGGISNSAHGDYSTIAGGNGNTTQELFGIYAAIGGGLSNAADGGASTVGGGANNTASGDGSTVSGGKSNSAGGSPFGTVAGGESNFASGNHTTVGGGHSNTASNDTSTVAGGNSNVATGPRATVGGGDGNIASGLDATVAGGSGNVASGGGSFAAGGSGNVASGGDSFAAGTQAKALHDGEFVWSDSNGNFDPGAILSGWSNPTNTFNVRATGGVWFVTGTSTSNPPGCSIGPGGGSWGCTSSRELKTDFANIDVRAVLDKVLGLPMQTWRFKTERADIRHLGAMAQDFHAAFGLGDSDRTIGMQDADGVALAAIQGLHQLVQEKDARIAVLEQEMADMRGELATLKAAIALAVTNTTVAQGSH